MLEVTYLDPPGLAPDYLTNLSEGGLFISTNTVLAVGLQVTLQIVSAKLPGPLVIRGVVRWRRAAGAECVGGAGIEFVFDEPDQVIALRKLVGRR